MRRCELPRATVPSNMYYPIRTALFEMPGSDELAKAAVEALRNDGDVILLQNHGLLASGQSMEGAMTAAIYAEECAEVGYYATLANMPQDSYIPESAALKIRQTALSGKVVKVCFLFNITILQKVVFGVENLIIERGMRSTWNTCPFGGTAWTFRGTGRF